MKIPFVIRYFCGLMPIIGQFRQTTYWGHFAGQTNLYRYCLKNNQIVEADPSQLYLHIPLPIIYLHSPENTTLWIDEDGGVWQINSSDNRTQRLIKSIEDWDFQEIIRHKK